MKDLFEDAYERAEARGIERGREEGLAKGMEKMEQSKIETAKKLITLGKLSLDDIAESTSLPLETVKQLAG